MAIFSFMTKYGRTFSDCLSSLIFAGMIPSRIRFCFSGSILLMIGRKFSIRKFFFHPSNIISAVASNIFPFSDVFGWFHNRFFDDVFNQTNMKLFCLSAIDWMFTTDRISHRRTVWPCNGIVWLNVPNSSSPIDKQLRKLGGFGKHLSGSLGRKSARNNQQTIETD